MFQSGFIGIIGKPNVGKSTLLNALVGERIAITMPKPQTTRNRIMGIKNLEGGQLIFLDTPGIHRPSSLLNRYMVDAALKTFGDSDLLLLVVEADRGFEEEDRDIIVSLQQVTVPVILAVNKIDRLAPGGIPSIINDCKGLYPFTAAVALSALLGDGIDTLLDEVIRLLPEGPRYFPDDMITDRSERFIAAEIIREKLTMATRQEVPYALAVLVDSFKERPDGSLLHIEASILVERESQKGILIGKRGAMLKKIGTEARLAMERFFACRVYLALFVKVRKDWTRDQNMLRAFGYGEKS
jgi:GTPase